MQQILCVCAAQLARFALSHDPIGCFYWNPPAAIKTALASQVACIKPCCQTPAEQGWYPWTPSMPRYAVCKQTRTHTHTQQCKCTAAQRVSTHNTGYSHVYDACGARPSGFTGLCAVRGHPLLCGWQRRASPSGTPGGCTERRPALQHQRHASSRSCLHLQVCGTRLWR